MTRDERERLDDIWEAIQRIQKTVNSGPQTPEAEAVARDATLYNLVIIGEAVKHLGEDPKARHPEIPWRRIAGLRDLLTHEYFRIEMAAIRKIVDRDLQPLERAIGDLRGRKQTPARAKGDPHGGHLGRRAQVPSRRSTCIPADPPGVIWDP